jgi:uncharacterized GH25 family protein
MKPAFHASQAWFTFVTVFVCATSLSAHEFWIEPTTFAPTPGKVIGIRARVGDGVLGDPVPRDPALLQELVVNAGSGRSPVVGRDGADPAGLLRITANGMHVVGYLGKPTPVELSAAKFNDYLKDEGLDAILAERTRLKTADKSVRELFTRCAKTLVLAGPARRDQRDQQLGFALELLSETNPYVLAPGDEFTFTLRYRGRPLGGALVTAIRRQDGQRLSVRSDASGRARFVLPAGGGWLIKSVYMTAAPANANADWVSYWASLTFELPTVAASADGAR